MSHTPHTLDQEFPEFAAQIDALKGSDAHFARIAEEYHEVNRKIHRWETNVEPVEDLVLIEARKQRGALKDEIYAALRAAQPTA